MKMKFPRFSHLLGGSLPKPASTPPKPASRPAAKPIAVMRDYASRFAHLVPAVGQFAPAPAAPPVAAPETREAVVHRLAANVINARRATPGRDFVFAPVAAPKVDDRTEKAKIADAKAIAARISASRGHPSNNRSF